MPCSLVSSDARRIMVRADRGRTGALYSGTLVSQRKGFGTL